MFQAAVVVSWLALVAIVAAIWRRMILRERTWQRLRPADSSAPAADLPRPTRRVSRRWFWVPWVFGVVVALIAWLVFRLHLPYVFASGLLIALLGSQVEAFLVSQWVGRLEQQLADAIDIMIGAVGAGASVGAAIEAAISESSRPLRPYLEEVAGRIRLGDDPAEVFRSLSDRIPLETFLLFTSALSVHWEVGGRLAPTLTTVGSTIRDRIEVSRRIRSNIVQSQVSTVAIIALTYFIAIVVRQNGPDQMREFVTSSIGSWFVAGSIVLQAIGIVWMNWISKPRF